MDNNATTTFLADRLRLLRRKLRDLEVMRIEAAGLERLLMQIRAQQDAGKTRRFGPRRAVVTLLETGPRPVKEVLDVLVDHVDSRATNIRRVVQTTLGQLKNEGRIFDRGDGQIELTWNGYGPPPWRSQEPKENAAGDESAVQLS